MNYLWANSTQAFGSFGPLKSGYRGFFHFSEMLYTHKMHTPSLSQHIISSFKLLSVSTHTHTHTHTHTYMTAIYRDTRTHTHSRTNTHTQTHTTVTTDDMEGFKMVESVNLT